MNAPEPDALHQRSDIARRALVGSAYSIGATGMTIVIGFARSVLLARLLFPEHFGVFALAMLFMELIGKVRSFGFDAALVHKNQASQEDMAAHFLLSVSTALVTALVVMLCAPLLHLFYPDEPRLAAVTRALALLNIIRAVNATPYAVLTRHLQFKRLALLDVGSSICAFGVGVLLALHGHGVWSLVGAQVGGQSVVVLGCWVWHRPWSPSIKTSRSALAWYGRFGWYTFLSSLLNFFLDRFDDFWIGTVLGSTPLGYYAKAYELALYPRRVIADPLVTVLFPTFARLQHDRAALSKAFVRSGSALVRVGFLFAGIACLIAPELVRLLLGQQWIPMIVVFQLMLIYTLLDPILILSSRLLIALGKPESLTRIKCGQVCLFMPLVIVAGRYWGIHGVAIAADLMVLSGLTLLVSHLRYVIDFSIWRLFVYPTVAMVLSVLLTAVTLRYTLPQPLWLSLILKVCITSGVYGLCLVTVERHRYMQAWHTLVRFWRQRRR